MSSLSRAGVSLTPQTGFWASLVPQHLWLGFLGALTRFCGGIWVERISPRERIFWDKGIWR